MKRAFIALPLVLSITAAIVCAQDPEDIFPMHVGDYRIFQTDTIGGGYNPSTFREDVEATDVIGGEEYFRVAQTGSGYLDTKWYSWIRFDTTGVLMGAYGDTSLIDSADVFDAPVTWFPADAVTPGYTWEFVFPANNMPYSFTLVSISETIQVPAGTFQNCAQVQLIATNEVGGDTNQIYNIYYAEGVGQVLNVGWTIWYDSVRLELVEYFVQSVQVEENTLYVPQRVNLYQNYPNPFNPVTRLRYGLPERTHVVLRIYDILGRPVRTLVMGVQEPGFKTVVWSGTNDVGEAISAGVYLYQMQAGDFTQTRKMILLK